MAERNYSFRLGETWELDVSLTDAAGAPLDLTGAAVVFRLARRGVLTLELSADGEEIVVESPPTGEGVITVSPDDQADVGLYAAVWTYEVRAELSDGSVSKQAHGVITVEGTLF